MWGIKGGLYWFKTRCLVIIIHFKTTVLSGKLEYSRKIRRYLGRDGRVFGGISARTEEFLEVSRPGQNSFFEVSRPGRNSAKTDIFDLLK